jgi:hypothetical protein
MFTAIDHVQMAMSSGGADRARQVYGARVVENGAP